MAQKFTKVDIGSEIELFFTGYVSYDDVSESDDFIEAIAIQPEDESIRVTLYHCQYLDFPDTEEDISEKDLLLLIDIYDDLYEDKHILFDEILEIDIDPLDENADDSIVRYVEEY